MPVNFSKFSSPSPSPKSQVQVQNPSPKSRGKGLGLFSEVSERFILSNVRFLGFMF